MGRMNPYRALGIRFVAWFKRSLSVLWLVIAAGYLMVLAGQAILHNYQTQQEIKGLQDKLSQAQLQKAQLKALSVYYQTDSFKEKELRRVLLMKRPEETVYALPESGISKQLEEEALATTDAQDKERSKPYWKQWIDYIVHPTS
jgi:cell division protein FtsB